MPPAAYPPAALAALGSPAALLAGRFVLQVQHIRIVGALAGEEKLARQLQAGRLCHDVRVEHVRQAVRLVAAPAAPPRVLDERAVGRHVLVYPLQEDGDERWLVQVRV